MKLGKLLVALVAAVVLLPCGSALAQITPTPPTVTRPPVIEADDAPPPVTAVFEAPAVAAPALVPGGPPIVGGFAPVPAVPPAAEGYTHTEGVDRVRITLNDSSQLIGEITPGTPVTVKAKFGEVKVTFEDIACIEQADKEGQWCVTLVGSDRITGELKLTGIKMKTALGDWQLDEAKIATIDFGKLHEREIAIHTTSPDGRTTSVAYRKQSVFVPLRVDNDYLRTNMPQPTTFFNPPTYYAPAPAVPSATFSVPTPAPAR